MAATASSGHRRRRLGDDSAAQASVGEGCRIAQLLPSDPSLVATFDEHKEVPLSIGETVRAGLHPVSEYRQLVGSGVTGTWPLVQAYLLPIPR